MTLSDQAILDYIAAHPGARREDIRRQAAPDASETTVWRVLKRLVEEGKLEVSGKGRATGYSLARAAVVRAHLLTRLTTAADLRATRRNSWTAIFRTRHSISPRLIGSACVKPARLPPCRCRLGPMRAAFLNGS